LIGITRISISLSFFVALQEYDKKGIVLKKIQGTSLNFNLRGKIVKKVSPIRIYEDASKSIRFLRCALNRTKQANRYVYSGINWSNHQEGICQGPFILHLKMEQCSSVPRGI
jgi:hypothetical protein